MVATISKHFTFHASHQLPNHNGPCARLHGHTYTLEVQVTGRVKPPNGDPDECMVIDFAAIKRVYHEHIEPRVEHQHLNDTLAGLLPETNIEQVEVTAFGKDPEYVDGHGDPVPTSEAIASWIWRVFNDQFPRVTLPERRITIRLWESPSSYAEVGPAPWRGEHR